MDGEWTGEDSAVVHFPVDWFGPGRHSPQFGDRGGNATYGNQFEFNVRQCRVWSGIRGRIDGFDSEDADDDFAVALVTSSKHRLILSNNHAPEVSAARFESAANRGPVELHEYEDIFSIQFPMLYLIAAGVDARLYSAH